jgi:hypothetical protein
MPTLSSNEKNSSDHHNSYNKGPNLAFFSFMESPSNSLPSTYIKNLKKSTYIIILNQAAQNSNGQNLATAVL